MTRISVAICTRDRADLLAQTLEQMTKMAVPSGLRWELLVVDNGSSDATADVMKRFAARLPLRGLHEPSPGLSHARNRAVREAAGAYLLWTDDDVLVDQGWLQAYAAAFRRWPDAAVFGGPIEPWWEGDPPPWLRAVWRRVRGAFSLRNLGDEPVPLAPDGARVPFGANYAVRAEEQRRHPYDPALGIQPSERWLRGEETEVLMAMLAEGCDGRWVPEARVRHWIPRGRQTVRFVRSIYYGLGQTASLTLEDRESPRLFGKPRWLYREALVCETRYRLGRLFSSPESWIEDLIRASSAWGRLRSFSDRPSETPRGELT